MTRILEKHIDYAVLYILLTQGPLFTSDLIPRVQNFLSSQNLLSPEDTEILNGRNDTKLSQIVRNIVSHRNIRGNLIHDGLLEYNSQFRALSITMSGKQKLERLISSGINSID